MAVENKKNSTEKEKKLEELRQYIAQRSHFNDRVTNLIIGALSSGDVPVDKIAALISEDQQQKTNILNRLDTLTRISVYANMTDPTHKAVASFNDSVNKLLILLEPHEIKSGEHVDTVLPLLMKGREQDMIEERLTSLRSGDKKAVNFR